jgi:hypothetical protein
VLPIPCILKTTATRASRVFGFSLLSDDIVELRGYSPPTPIPKIVLVIPKNRKIDAPGASKMQALAIDANTIMTTVIILNV